MHSTFCSIISNKTTLSSAYTQILTPAVRCRGTKLQVWSEEHYGNLCVLTLTFINRMSTTRSSHNIDQNHIYGNSLPPFRYAWKTAVFPTPHRPVIIQRQPDRFPAHTFGMVSYRLMPCKSEFNKQRGLSYYHQNRRQSNVRNPILILWFITFELTNRFIRTQTHALLLRFHQHMTRVMLLDNPTQRFPDVVNIVVFTIIRAFTTHQKILQRYDVKTITVIFARTRITFHEQHGILTKLLSIC